MSLPPATSRAALPFTQRLLGAENFDEWFFELTSVILAGEDLTEMATHCAQVETATSMKGLRRAYKVLLNDCKRIRQHEAEAVLPASPPPLPPLTLDAHPSLGPELTEWLADNRSTDEAIAKSIRNDVDELIKWRRRPSRAHASWSTLPCPPWSSVMPLPGFATNNMRQLLEQYWPGLVTKRPHYLGPAPIAAAAPVHGSATATTRSSALALPAFRDGASQREGYGQAATVPWGTQGQDPMADW
ncbi:hypothetical protein DYB28_014373, partial [Aphanomyces astaci]